MLRQFIDFKKIYTGHDRLVFNLKKIFPNLLGSYMNKQLRFIFFIFLLIGSGIRSVNAQNTFSTEEELKQQALKLFEDDEFEEAFPLYSQLVSLYPKDPNYNYRLGVCMLYASDDKEKAIPFLEFASQKPDVEKEVFFYLAKAYHLNYRFDDAITKYMAYQKVASEAKANKLQVGRQIEMCRNGKKLLRNITDLVVIDKKELSKADFYRAYDISDIGGKLLAKPDEDAFKTPLDKKKKEKSIIYLASNNNQIFFSSYGDDLEHGKDIFVIRKLPNGEWSKPQTLGYPVNTEYDEDFPFLHPNGKVLYFCSKGHNSMGGYDIFKTTLNEETNTWNKPVNLDFPINTPDDDILYVTNEDEKEAYFSSARSSKIGKTAVFHINVERRPIEVAIIKGAVVKNRDNQALDVKITIKDLGDNTILGIYNSKPESGGYLINLPNGGKFMYTVEAAGFSTQSEVVNLPTQYEFKPLKQEISYELGTDKLIIKNLFDEPADEQSYLLALNFIKDKAKLEAGTNETPTSVAKTENANDNSTGQNNVSKTEDNNKTNTTPTKLSNNDIIKIAYDDAKEAETEAKDLQEQADIALNLANQKNELAQSKNNEATKLLSDANAISDNIKKQAAIDEANQTRADAEELNQETVAAFNIAKKIGLKAAAKDQEADMALQYAKDLEAAVKSKDPLQALTKLEEQEKKLEALSEQNGKAEPDNIFAGLKMDSENKKRELDKAIQTSADIKQEIADNETLITNLQAEADKTKKDDLKKGLLDQIEGLKADNDQSKKDLAANDLKVLKNLKEFNGIKNEMELVNNVVDKSKTGTNEDAAASVAAIDKSKLEAQVNEIKSGSTEVVPDNRTVSSEIAKYNNENKTSDVAVNANSENKTETKSADNNSTNEAKNVNENVVTNADKTDYKKQLEDQLASADNITDPLDRENKKAELYKDLTAAINTELTQKKQDVKTEKDKDKKKTLNSEIALLEKDLKAKQEEEKVVVAKVDKLKTESSVANNSTENKLISQPQEINTINETFNNQLADADKISNETERENAKADVLQKWSAAIDNSIDKQKKDFVTTTDPKLKAELAKQISDAETVSKEKKTLANESLAKADAIKSVQNPITVNDANTNANNKVSENAAVSNSEVINDINKTYNDQLVEVNKMSDEAERENAKADVLKKWSAALDSNIDKQKKEFATTTDPELKTLLAKQISDAESVSSEKKSLANESNAKADALKSSQTITVNTENNQNKTADAVSNNENNTKVETNVSNDSNLSPTQKLDNSIAVAEKSNSELERENKKKEAYENYITAQNQLLTAKETSVKSEKDKAKKKELTAEIASINADVKEKQKLLDDINIKVNTLEDQAAVAKDNSVKTNTDQSTQLSYTNSVAIEKSKASDIAKKESEDLKTQANDLKIEAAEKNNQSEKDALFVKANDLLKQSDAKQVEASQLSSDANQTEFLSNKNELDQLALITTNNTSDEISMAEMMKDESAIYFDKAKKSRELAANTTLNEDKIAALTDALNNEQIALEKQKRSVEIYKKNNPGFVAKSEIVSTENAKASDLTQNNNATNTEKVNDNAINNTEVKNRSTELNNNNSAEEVSKVNETKSNDIVNSESKTTNDSLNAGNKTKSNEVVKTADESKTNDIAVNNADNKTKSNDEVVKTNDESKTTDASANKVTDNSAKESSNELVGNPTNNKSTTALPVNEKFERTTKPVYSASNPIPVNEKLPDGLIYKVQIGAFRNPIDPEQFKGMSPLTAETTPQGLTRYTAGLFTKFETADKVKNEIRELGYKDAFVVGFFNGKRISTAEALQIGGTPGLATTNPVPNDQVKKDVANNNLENPAIDNTTKNSNNQNLVSGSKNIAPTENINAVSGLFYTVQVGVFSQPVTSAKLFNIQPLYTETAANGNLRYNTGIYNNVGRANQARAVVFNAGVKDAFVVAYYQGKRITLPEAKKIEEQGSAVFSTAPNINQLPTISADQTTVINDQNKEVVPKNSGTITNPETEKPVNKETEQTSNELKNTVEQNVNALADTGVVFKIQIGAFKDEVPLEIANQFLKIANKGIKNYKDDKGLTIYTLGIFKTYEDASKTKLEISSIVTDAFIVAYNNGKKISIDEAKALQNK